MKIKCYLRIGKTGKYKAKFAVSIKPNYDALDNGQKGKWKTVYPTVSVPLELSIPDSLFESATELVSLEITKAKEAVEIKEGSEEASVNNYEED